MLRIHKCIALGFVLTLATISIFSESRADVTRSCGASYSVCPSGGGSCWSFDFTGRGTVGYFNPNEARRRARHNIDECIDTHWRNYTSTGRPQQCTSSNQVYGYGVGSLIVDMSRNICRRNPGRSSVVVSIRAIYSGDRGCTLRNNSWNREIARNHTVRCPGAEVEPNTDRPGSDYRSFFLNRPVPDLCRSQCARENRCKAYTYVKPGVQGRRAKCWLKHSVPAARHNTNCVSGVKTDM